METTEELRTTEGILKAIEWLRQMGRPILAAKMERELLNSRLIDRVREIGSIEHQHARATFVGERDRRFHVGWK